MRASFAETSAGVGKVVDIGGVVPHCRSKAAAISGECLRSLEVQGWGRQIGCESYEASCSAIHCMNMA